MSTLEHEYFPEVSRTATSFTEWFYKDEEEDSTIIWEERMGRVLGKDFDEVFREHVQAEEELERERERKEREKDKRENTVVIVKEGKGEVDEDEDWDVVSNGSTESIEVWEEVFLD